MEVGSDAAKQMYDWKRTIGEQADIAKAEAAWARRAESSGQHLRAEVAAREAHKAWKYVWDNHGNVRKLAEPLLKASSLMLKYATLMETVKGRE